VHLQKRALSAYIQRTYFPHMVAQPMIQAPAPGANGLITAVWHYADPRTAGLPHGAQCAGAAALIHSLSQVREALDAVRGPLASLGSLIDGGVTLQLVLVGKGTDAFSLDAGAPPCRASTDPDHATFIDSFVFAADSKLAQVAPPSPAWFPIHPFHSSTHLIIQPARWRP
jgi:hypothetical protein